MLLLVIFWSSNICGEAQRRAEVAFDPLPRHADINDGVECGKPDSYKWDYLFAAVTNVINLIIANRN